MRVILESVYKEGGRAGIDALYAIMEARSTEDDPHVNISHREMPSYRRHSAFVRSKPYRAWLFVKVDGLVAGSVNITKRNEVGIVLLPDYRGKGVGKMAIRMLLATFTPLPAIPGDRPGTFVANINPANYRSISLFQALGGVHIQNTYALPQEGW